MTTAKPFVEQAVTFLTTTEPALLGQYALGLVAAWYLAPPLLRATTGYLRGYAGEVTAAAALTAVESEVRSRCPRLPVAQAWLRHRVLRYRRPPRHHPSAPIMRLHLTRHDPQPEHLLNPPAGRRLHRGHSQPAGEGGRGARPAQLG